MSTSCHGITSLLSDNRDSSTVVYKSDGRGRVFSNTQLSPCRYCFPANINLSPLQQAKRRLSFVAIYTWARLYITVWPGKSLANHP